MKFSKPIQEIIRERTSRRTFLDKSLEKDVRQELEDFLKLDEIESPFKDQGGTPRFKLISLPDIDPEKNIKIGTYGMIKGAREFIAGAIENDKHDLENYGYHLEAIILKTTDLGLGTCWLGGTFSRSQFSEFIKIREGEKIPAISPIGYSSSRRAKERIIRSVVRAKVRKPWEDIFSSGVFAAPLRQDSLGNYKIALEMLRIGPSAGNKQPWRILKDAEKNTYHFFGNPM